MSIFMGRSHGNECINEETPVLLLLLLSVKETKTVIQEMHAGIDQQPWS